MDCGRKRRKERNISALVDSIQAALRRVARCRAIKISIVVEEIGAECQIVAERAKDFECSSGLDLINRAFAPFAGLPQRSNEASVCSREKPARWIARLFGC